MMVMKKDTSGACSRWNVKRAKLRGANPLEAWLGRFVFGRFANRPYRVVVIPGCHS
jgi:hypothetical protein